MTDTYYPDLDIKLINILQVMLINWWKETIYSQGMRNFFWRNWILDPAHPIVKLEKTELPRDFGIFCCEIVLRLTRAENVETHFRPFFKKLQSFDDIKNVANEDLIELIRPLGRISQNLKDLKEKAIIIIEKFNSKVPITKDDIRKLMKTGKRKRHIYFVEAIGLYVHGLFGAPVDVNVERIYVRLFNIKRKQYGVQDDLEFCDYAKKFVPKNNAIFYNLALLDLGALICTSKRPKCSECPLNSLCSYKKSNRISPKKHDTQK